MLVPLNKAYRHGWQTKGDALKLEIGLHFISLSFEPVEFH
jgi:hypothetical protein